MKKHHICEEIFLAFLVILCLVPLVFVLAGGLYQKESGFSFLAYYDVFLGSSQYLLRFWRSLAICLCITMGQILVSILGGYGFAKCDFPGKNMLFYFLMILMVLPLQVTLVPNYIMLDKLGMLGTDAALIAPSIFVPLGTFIMTQSFKAVSDEIIDAARIDGCGIAQILRKIAIPVSKGGVVCTGLLAFLDAWNMVEQPIAYLKEFADYPISVALAYVSPVSSTRQYACCLLVLLPPLFLFSYYNKEMLEGIIAGEGK